ncbi:cell division protein FtsZ [Lacihabitans sp. LS3-19]|uniref:cell division protein FtsZ n=1 Tax=Lacihabitans sp. LS3-19 TaxID=2487335 RepID=UPI0020CE391C|nr:cell division protein FtsZ [Lacihabitans sp. LS3-19]MCP9769194.1 cell division protein FtsZ [Lacihabitans sp. LS3-19]
MILEPEYTLDFKSDMQKIIKVIGVGGGGGNAMLNMYHQGVHDVDFVACNTDAQALKQFPEDVIKLQLGAELTKGLGAGTDWKVGKQAAIESEKSINDLLEDPTEMVFITAGMGGGTGTGAAPEIARYAKSKKRLTIGVVTDPFRHEGLDKFEQATNGIAKLKDFCDTVLVIKNDRLVEMYGDLDIESAYKKADEVLANAVKSIAELITRPGIVNLDFADVKTVLGDAGHAVMGSAEASGPDRASIAIEAALNSPLLENNNIKGAKRILVSIAYSDELPEYKIKMSDQAKVTDFVESQIKSRAKIFKHGFAIDRTLKDKVRVTIVAARFDEIFEDIEPEEPKKVEETKPEVGKGIHAIIPEKPAKISLPKPTNQIGLFEQEDKFLKTIQEMTKNGVDVETLIESPAYKRYGVELLDADEIGEENLEKINLVDLYTELSNQKLID